MKNLQANSKFAIVFKRKYVLKANDLRCVQPGNQTFKRQLPQPNRSEMELSID